MTHAPSWSASSAAPDVAPQGPDASSDPGALDVSFRLAATPGVDAPSQGQHPKLRCANHPGASAIALCTGCGAFICSACHNTDAHGLAECDDCLMRAAYPDADPSAAGAAAEGRTLDGADARDEDAAPPKVPFEDDTLALPLWRRFGETVRLVLTQPVPFFQRVARSQALGRPFVFGYLCLFVGVALSVLWQMTLGGADTEMVKTLAEQNGMTLEQLQTAQIIMIPFVPLLQLILGTAMLHAAALLVGGVGTGRQSLQIYAYASACQFFLLIPVLGGMLALGLQVLTHFVGLRVVHGLSTMRAAIGCVLLTAPLLLLGASLGLG